MSTEDEKHEELRVLITELNRETISKIQEINSKVDAHIIVDAAIHEDIKGVIEFVKGFKTSLKFLAIVGGICRWIATVIVAAATAFGALTALKNGHFPAFRIDDIGGQP